MAFVANQLQNPVTTTTTSDVIHTYASGLQLHLVLKKGIPVFVNVWGHGWLSGKTLRWSGLKDDASWWVSFKTGAGLGYAAPHHRSQIHTEEEHAAWILAQ